MYALEVCCGSNSDISNRRRAKRVGRDVQDYGQKKSELIREAVDCFLDWASGSRQAAILKEAAGMWQDRRDVPDLDATRRSWDRG